MWRRAAWAALVSIVAFAIPLEYSEGIALPVATESKLGQAPFSENVPISDLAVNVYRFSVFENCLLFKRRQLTLKGRESHGLSAGRNDTQAWIFNTVKSESLSQRKLPHLNLGPLENIVSRGFAIVFYIDENGKPRPFNVARIFDPRYASDANIGPQFSFCGVLSDLIAMTSGVCGSDGRCNGILHIARLGNGGFSQKPKLLLASNPKLIGGEPQANGGNSQYNGEAADNTFVVSFKDSVQRVNRGDYSRVEGGAIFWVNVIGGLLTVLWLYQAQR